MNGRSSGLHSTPLLGPLYLLLNLFASRTRTLGRRYRSGLLPYPRSMSSSLAPEWIEVRVKRRLKLTLLLALAFISKWMPVVGTSASFQSP